MGLLQGVSGDRGGSGPPLRCRPQRLRSQARTSGRTRQTIVTADAATGRSPTGDPRALIRKNIVETPAAVRSAYHAHRWPRNSTTAKVAAATELAMTSPITAYRTTNSS